MLGFELDRLTDGLQRVVEPADADEQLSGERASASRVRIKAEGEIEIAQCAANLSVSGRFGTKEKRLSIDGLEQDLRDERRLGSVAEENAPLGKRFADRLAGLIGHRHGNCRFQM